ncbi:F-box/FBD/LRR-repeat protein At1g13570-like [Solanum pennellii]|uniref:F-box/FBD/LRR-repeat protein At1g13570-like n=1 Tax=Solanum pennellii TaxID=28526 RepID=A0ABM1GKU9_SOLPN|nr:F-box/FBD/LRR-repeat protein At1g13570-like [Solanum pennellii]
MTQDSKRVAVVEDRISVLPSNVIDHILELLMVHDAARTSILSKNWRYIWAKLPNLVLDKQFCMKLAKKSHNVFKETIDMILLQHIGDIVKFHLDVSGLHLSTYADIDRWMLYVTRNGVKKLKLKMTEDENYEQTSYIFNCPTLTHLKLFNCFFKLPDSFLGFQTLTVLQFESIIFVPEIEFCTINVPLLVKLTIELCYGTEYLNIVFSSELKSLVIVDSCYIETALRTLAYPRDTLFGCNPKGASCTLNCLWRLFICVNFNEIGQTSYTLELIKSSPNLSKLEIWDYATGDTAEEVMKYLDTPACLDKTLNQLEDVSIYSFNYSNVVLSFVKLLFAHAPSLSRMIIHPDKASSSEEELNVAKELMRFTRASPKAELIYRQNYELD